MALQHGALHLLRLMGGEVAVLQRQLRQTRLAAGDEGAVEFGEFAPQHLRGPAVRSHVVDDDQQDVLVLAQPRQDGPDHQVAAQVEGVPGLLLQQPAGGFLAPVLRLAADVQHANFYGHRRPDDLHGRAVHAGERRAQRLMPFDYGAERPAERVDVQRPLQAVAGRDVVSAGAGLQLFDEPEPLLGERGRAWSVGPAGRDAPGALTPPRLAQQHLLQRRPLPGGQPGRTFAQVVLRHVSNSRPSAEALSTARPGSAPHIIHALTAPRPPRALHAPARRGPPCRRPSWAGRP